MTSADAVAFARSADQDDRPARRTYDVRVSTRERATLLLGILGALLLVLYPLAYRLTSERADTTALVAPTARPMASRPATAAPPATATPKGPASGELVRATEE